MTQLNTFTSDEYHEPATDEIASDIQGEEMTPELTIEALVIEDEQQDVLIPLTKKSSE